MGLSTPVMAEDDLTFMMVTHSPSSDPYWTSVVSGLEQAGEDLGVNVIYRGTDKNLNDPNQQQRNIEAAIASSPDGLIISNPSPDSLNDSILKATDAGIPVILVNQGGDQVEAVNALTFVGDDPTIQGQIGAAQYNAMGAKKALVITTPIGAIPFVDARTNGFSDTFNGGTTLAEIPVSNLNDANRIKTITMTELTKDPEIDAVFSIGSCCISAMLEARNDLGDRGEAMQWGTIDVTVGATDALKAGEMDFALNAQQYAQGYYPVVLLALYHRQAVLPATSLFITGPAVITPENVDSLLAVQ
ncbi:Inositol transport system sugar-binding protein [Candidatus Rhodobacter oscarellae]|uniref:Inositol transport system sugar-binding protein n=2 Tax=Candidatus Rhodobacter oscarellae TaxID=1675527 RepID=A0A0J9EAJ5_9RHOB|nr:Inositol transport system sugar-binding protein [Candidatus Rhodobacter lobularis]